MSLYVTNGTTRRTWVQIPTNIVGFQIQVYPDVSRATSVPGLLLVCIWIRLDFRFLIWANKGITQVAFEPGSPSYSSWDCYQLFYLASLNKLLHFKWFKKCKSLIFIGLFIIGLSYFLWFSKIVAKDAQIIKFKEIGFHWNSRCSCVGGLKWSEPKRLYRFLVALPRLRFCFSMELLIQYIIFFYDKIICLL